MNFLNNINALLIDLDGTLLAGDRALPGLVPFLKFLNDHNIKFLILSNNSTKVPDFYSQKFARLGIDIDVAHILTCALVTADYMKSSFTGEIVYVIGEEGIQQALLDRGYKLVFDNKEQADFVVVGGDHFLTYDKLKYGCLQLQGGAKFIGTNPDVVSPSEEGLIPECGTNIAALEAASCLKATIVGKPNPLMFTWGLQRLKSRPEKTAMLGDRLDTDIMGAQRTGLHTILVESGVDNSASATNLNIHPDLIVSDLPDLLSRWQSALTN